MYGLKVVVGLELTLGVWGYGWLSGVQDQRANGAEFTQEVAVVERSEDVERGRRSIGEFSTST